MLEFEKRDKMHLRVLLAKVIRFHKSGKLSLRFIGLYDILEIIDSLAYRLVLPFLLSRIHNAFYISQLRRCLHVPQHVLEDQPWEDMDLNLIYKECPIRIVDRKEQVSRNRALYFVKVQWSYHDEKEA